MVVERNDQATRHVLRSPKPHKAMPVALADSLRPDRCCAVGSYNAGVIRKNQVHGRGVEVPLVKRRKIPISWTVGYRLHIQSYTLSQDGIEQKTDQPAIISKATYEAAQLRLQALRTGIQSESKISERLQTA